MAFSASEYRALNLWFSQLPDFSIRPQLTKPHHVDIAIIGAGFTGLWTAYYLKRKSPELRIAVFESEVAGFGASGRNGGWFQGELAGQDSYLKGLPTHERSAAHDLLHGIPSELGSVVADEGIDCDFAHNGVLYVAARYKEQQQWLEEYALDLRSEGYTEHDYRLLDETETKQRIQIPSARSALFSPHVARIQPAKLVRGLADVCERMGVEVFEHSPVQAWQKGCVELENGTKIRCAWVVPALEAYGVTIKSAPFSWKRYQRPVQSAIVATEPLSEALWKDIGLDNGEVFSEFSRVVSYAHRSADQRLVFGARGSYLYGAALENDARLSTEGIKLRRTLMTKLLPQLEGVNITHAWAGNLAISRKFRTHMLVNKDQCFALSAAYGGEGLGASHLAGRTLSDLILGRDTLETRMPWVDHSGSFAHSKAWEPEPIPWLGYRTLSSISALEDRLLSEGKSDTLTRKLADKAYRYIESKMA